MPRSCRGRCGEGPCLVRVCVTRSGSPQSGATITIRHNGVAVASGTTGSDGCWEIDLVDLLGLSGPTLPSGTWSISAVFFVSAVRYSRAAALASPCQTFAWAIDTPASSILCTTDCDLPATIEGLFVSIDDPAVFDRPFTLTEGPMPAWYDPFGTRTGRFWSSTPIDPGEDWYYIQTFMHCDPSAPGVNVNKAIYANFITGSPDWPFGTVVENNFVIFWCDPLDVGLGNWAIGYA